MAHQTFLATDPQPGGRARRLELVVGEDVAVRTRGMFERHVESQAELQGVVDAYAQHSEAAGVPAILATLRTASELDAFS